MASPSKTPATSLLSLQSVAASSVLLSSAVSVATKYAISVFCHFGRRSATAAGAGVNFRLEGSSKSSGDGHWYPIATYTTDFVAAEAEAVSGTEAAGSTVIEVASTTNLTAGDIIYFDNGTIANSEWARVKSVVAATSVTLEDAITNAQTGATLYDRAEIFGFINVPLDAVTRIRLVVDGASFTQAFAVESHYTTLDSIG
jgi:hypothetical protein